MAKGFEIDFIGIELEIKNLEEQLGYTPNGFEQIKILNDLGWLCAEKLPQRAIEFAEQALEKSREIDYTLGMAYAHRSIGWAKFHQSKHSDCIRFLFKAQHLFQQINQKNELVNLLNMVGDFFSWTNLWEDALVFYLEAFKHCTDSTSPFDVANTHKGIGQVYIELGLIEKGLESLYESIGIARENHIKQVEADCLNKISIGFLKLDKLLIALEYFSEGLEIARESKLEHLGADILLNLSLAYVNQENYSLALSYAEESLKIRRELNYEYGQALSLQSLIRIQLLTKDHKVALDSAKQLVELCEGMKNQELISKSHGLLAEVYEASDDLTNFIHHFKISKSKDSNGSNYRKENGQNNYSDLIQAIKDTEKEKILSATVAQKENGIHPSKDRQNNIVTLSEIGQEITSKLDFKALLNTIHKQVNNLMDASGFFIGIFNENRKKIEVRLAIEKGIRSSYFEYDLKDTDRLPVWCVRNQKEVFINDYLKEAEKYISVIQTPVLGDMIKSTIMLPLRIKDKVIGVIAVHSFQNNAYTFEHLDLLRNVASYTAIALDNAKAYERLNTIHKVLEEKNKHITDSIIYAKNIQNALLPKLGKNVLSRDEIYVLHQPKDIVSGDFYWYHQINPFEYLFAVADCTGHGVPGAFMSILGMDGLNQVVKQLGITKPSEILNLLSDYIETTLSSQGSNKSALYDGMDIALIFINTKSKEIQFAGANNPFYLVRDNELQKIKGNKRPIGYFHGTEDSFTNHKVQLQTNDQLYIFSDGYKDQFGGIKGKKLKTSGFDRLILESSQESFTEQCDFLKDQFHQWKGENQQVDDICIMSLKI